ncbi:MAG TPA: hypothetical protein H9782_11315 [Candidatus Bariatricus faecipullorum]|nr:hypothetical protein [Candidatus Bariatricus faecipullorum]
MIRISLTEEQVIFLEKMFPDEEIVQSVLHSKNDKEFFIDVDTKIDFMDFLEDAAVGFMDENQEPTFETKKLEEIRDSIYYQTN